MTLDLLVCPGCRTLSGDRLDVRTLDRTGDVLACECGRRYPIVDDVPIVMKDPAAYVRSEIATIVERDLPPAVAAELAADGPDDAPYPRMLEHLSIYFSAFTPAHDAHPEGSQLNRNVVGGQTVGVSKLFRQANPFFPAVTFPVVLVQSARNRVLFVVQ